MENSSRCLADAEKEALLDSIDSDVSFTENHLEEEVDFDSDDSLEDPDFSPEFQENTFEEELMKAVESAQNMASEKKNKGPLAKKQKSAPTVQLQLNDIEDVSSVYLVLIHFWEGMVMFGVAIQCIVVAEEQWL
ncbi:uncharacterized protein LOC128866745 isoform X1 [Anastrepha ludens]|uniref:uncharacterized protein LOC128866745 isoform X1 n=1 Tax=Anastrepha ludens TaxID=28586 RepID=UPI0023B1F70D|nr:uncharacterized protein LOC128866745 isoform X1 [Anastrepha ludens]